MPGFADGATRHLRSIVLYICKKVDFTLPTDPRSRNNHLNLATNYSRSRQSHVREAHGATQAFLALYTAAAYFLYI